MQHATYLAGEIGPRLTGTKPLARAERWTRDQFEAFGLVNVHLQKWGEMESTKSPRARKATVSVHNVIADIRGSERPDELVIVGAHLDSYDLAHGATDNAAGCAAVMEAARLIVASGVQPRRTIRFVLWTGEEQGLLGSRAYVAAHADQLAKISAVFNMDAGTNPVTGFTATSAMKNDLERALAGIEPPLALETAASLTVPDDCCSQTINPATGTCTGASASCALPPDVSGCPSDHVAFLRAGVPAFMFQQKGSADYGRTHHSEHDTVDALDAKGIEHSAVVIAMAALGVADLPNLLSRDNLIATNTGGGAHMKAIPMGGGCCGDGCCGGGD
jgi:Zn-dependent M28 family amino/carboxypeptidase